MSSGLKETCVTAVNLIFIAGCCIILSGGDCGGAVVSLSLGGFVAIAFS